MAVSSRFSPLLFLLLLLFLLFTSGCAFLFDRDHAASPAPLGPHFTECLSRDQATFRCWWSPGSVLNSSSADTLRVFYLKKQSPTNTEWRECPQYDRSKRECFFDSNHTVIWFPYCLQLRGPNVTYFNEDDCFTVENIVRPDPPVALNWTLVNVSPSGRSYDILVSWDPPPSADVRTGWISLVYELQYRLINASKWEVSEVQAQTQQTVYGLHSGREYEVHVRCRMHGFTKFGPFSESLYVQTASPGDDGTSVPIMMALIFGILGVVIMMMFIVVSQQHRLMMILLPPVPAPKIKGIDSELLKKGKLEELNLILGGGGMDLPPHPPDCYQDEPWVEFIEVDAAGVEGGEEEDGRRSDTQRLLSLPAVPPQSGCSNDISFPDDDSGRASCSDQDPLLLGGTLLPGQPEHDKDPSHERAPVVSPAQPPQTWINTDFYAQVSNVMTSGGVVLSPGQLSRVQEDDLKKKGRKREGNSGDVHFQLVVVDSESADVPQQSADPEPQSPYILPPDAPQPPLLTPVPDYTVVQEVDSQHSLLLTPPTPLLPPHLLKSLPAMPAMSAMPAMPAMPAGYVTPDLLGNMSP